MQRTAVFALEKQWKQRERSCADRRVRVGMVSNNPLSAWNRGQKWSR